MLKENPNAAVETWFCPFGAHEKLVYECISRCKVVHTAESVEQMVVVIQRQQYQLIRASNTISYDIQTWYEPQLNSWSQP